MFWSTSYQVLFQSRQTHDKHTWNVGRVSCRTRHKRTEERTDRELAVLSFAIGCEQPLRNKKQNRGKKKQSSNAVSYCRYTLTAPPVYFFS